MLIDALISLVLREEMLTCFVTFAFINVSWLASTLFLAVQYIQVSRTCIESCLHKGQGLVFPQELPKGQYFVYHKYENSRLEKAAENTANRRWRGGRFPCCPEAPKLREGKEKLFWD